MFIDALIEDLEKENIATFGVDLFGSLYPADAPDACMLIKSTGGPPPSKYIPVQVHQIQFLVRDIRFPDAHAKAMEIFKLYHGEVKTANWKPRHNYIVGVTAGEQYYVSTSNASQMPIDISPDEKNRAEVSLNISFRVRLS